MGAAYAASLLAAGAAEALTNMLGKADLKTPAGWGVPVSIPEDTGEFSAADNALTMVR